FRVVDAAPDALPDDRHYRYLFARIERRENRFVKLNWVNRDLRFEDFNLGLELSAQFGFSPRAAGAGADTGMARVSAARGARLGDRTFVLSRFGWESRLGAADANALLSAELFGIHRLSTRQPQTFVARIHYDQGNELDRDRQLFADADSGLRGYRLHAIEGERILIVNAEHRIFLGRELFHLVAPGIAFFADVGGAARPGAPLDLYRDAGVGLTLGLTRSPKNSLRIDFAWALDPDPLGREGLLMSVSMSRAF
ncbi:MAG: hypothetical protein LC732_10550, partial [Acidobacteria bacterium]|nr:hypothetical protein [Acidobacteriota bacterium]